MKLSRRKDKAGSSVVPAEIQEYYNAEQRERVGLAWIIAVISLLVSLAVIFGIFFGGRYVYRNYIHKSKTTTSKPVKTPTSGTVGQVSGPSNTDQSNGSQNGTSATQSLPTDGASAGQSNTSTTSNSAAANPPSLVKTGPDSTEE